MKKFDYEAISKEFAASGENLWSYCKRNNYNYSTIRNGLRNYEKSFDDTKASVIKIDTSSVVASDGFKVAVNINDVKVMVKFPSVEDIAKFIGALKDV